MAEDKTTLWENVKNRIDYLRSGGRVTADSGLEIAKALTEELERINEKIDANREMLSEHLQYHQGL